MKIERIPYIYETEFSVKKRPRKALLKCLKVLSNPQLDEIISSYDNTGTFSFDSKKEKIQFLYTQILSSVSDFFVYHSQFLYGTFKYLLDTRNSRTGVSEVSQFIPMTDENKQEVDEYNFYYDLMEVLFTKGFVFQFFKKRKGDSFVIPEEVCGKISKALKVQDEGEFGKWGNIDIFASRIISFYGILSAQDFATLWNIQFPENELTESQAENHLKKCAEAKKSFVWFDDLKIAAKNFLPKQQAADILEKRQDFELYVPEKEELNEWWNDFSSADSSQLDCWGDYEAECKNPYYSQMKNFLQNLLGTENDSWSRILYRIMFYIKNNFTLESALLYLQKKFALIERFDDSLSQQFVSLYVDLHDSSHSWLNYGWKFNDLPDEEEE
ncbi:MAG: hypothetical protein SO116_03165 [Treponema sp.]|nr:hypothetical protein [Treponema sp.]